jgi:hypothetical protein
MKINISDEVFAEIGKITVVFAYLEYSLAEIIGKIITVGGRVHELGVIVTAELSFKQRISTLDSLLLFALAKDSPCLAEFNRIKPLLFRAEEDRNRVVHSVWGKDSNDPCPHAVIRMKSTAKQKKGLRVDFVPLHLDDLRAISDCIGKTYGELCIFETQFNDSDQNANSDTNCCPE